MADATPDQAPVTPVNPEEGVATDLPPNDEEPDRELVDQELVVEEVSIDGMCGVY